MNNKGFTLIELIMVIVILGLLAVVAIPKYRDLRTEASNAAANGVYGAAQGAAAINFSTRLVTPGAATAITTGATLLEAMEGTPDGWKVSGSSQIYTTVGASTYSIIIATVEDATPTRRAILSKSGF